MKSEMFINIFGQLMFCAGMTLAQNQKQICQNSEGGSLSVSPSSRFVGVVPEEDKRTVFMRTTGELVFHCSLPGTDAEAKISFTPKLPDSEETSSTSNGIFTSSRSLNSSSLKFANFGNSVNLNVACKKIDKSSEARIISDICKVNLIAVNEILANCTGRQNLTCAAKDILEKVIGGQFDQRPVGTGITEHYGYSVYEPTTTQQWIPCKQLDRNGYCMKNGTHLYSDTETIVCPFNSSTHGNPEKLALIRVEKTEKSSQSMALPFFAPKPKSTFTYFMVILDLDQSVPSQELQTGSVRLASDGQRKSSNLVALVIVLIVMMSKAVY